MTNQRTDAAERSAHVTRGGAGASQAVPPVRELRERVAELEAKRDAALARAEKAEGWLAKIEDGASERSLRRAILKMIRMADCLMDDAKAAHARFDTAQAHAARLEEALLGIAQRCEAYPVDVFRPESADKALAAMRAHGIDPGALHASWARHLLSGISSDARAALGDAT